MKPANFFANLRKSDIIPERKLDKINIRECGEPLIEVNLSNTIISKSEKRLEFDKNNMLYARQGVVERLEKARKLLLQNMLFKIFDAYRPFEFQKMLFEEEYAIVKASNPYLSEQKIREIVFVSVFPPSTDPKKPAPHLTGGAVDLTIINESGQEIDMGCRYCEFGSKMYTNSKSISSKQRQNRLLLLNLMADAGFANFPGEWWHYMYGEREWAAYVSLMKSRRTDAIYGAASTS